MYISPTPDDLKKHFGIRPLPPLPASVRFAGPGEFGDVEREEQEAQQAINNGLVEAQGGYQKLYGEVAKLAR